MPKILEIKNAPDGMWVKVGQPGEFPSGATLWTPEEKKVFRNNVLEHAAQVAEEAFRGRNIARNIRSLKSDVA